MERPFDISADLDTPVSTFLKLKPLNPCFLLESVEGGTRLARYSFLGLGEVSRIVIRDGKFYAGGESMATPKSTEELLQCFRQVLKDLPDLKPEITDMPFSGGLVGFGSYDLVRYFESIPKPTSKGCDLDPPDASYIAPKSLIIFDHLTRRIALLHAGSESSRMELKRQVIKLLRGPIPINGHKNIFDDPEPNLSEAEFHQAVKTAKHHIREGDVYQIVLSIKFGGTCDLDPFQVYRAMRLLNPSPYMFFCDLGDFQVVGSSPEALVRLNNSHASLRPIAGTRPRGEDPAQDRALEDSLIEDEKENAEHVMLVDLARNDLGRVAKEGSIVVDPYKSIERYSHVMHIVSGVQGELVEEKDAFDLFAATFPAGTLVGAPKVRAMELIDAIEPDLRGIYGGTVGYFGKNGDMDQAIAIRTIVFSKGRYSFQAGGGIVADSTPEYEFKEVLAKSAILRAALAMAVEEM